MIDSISCMVVSVAASSGDDCTAWMCSFQSTGSPAASAAATDISRSDSLIGHLPGEAHKRPSNSHLRRLRTVLLQLLGDLPPAELHLDSRHDRLTMLGCEPLEGRLVAVKQLGTHREFQRRRLGGRKVGANSLERPSLRTAHEVDDPVLECLPNVSLKGPFVARYEGVETSHDMHERVLHEIPGVDHAARVRGQTAVSLALHAGKEPGTQRLDRGGVTVTRAGDQVDGRLGIVRTRPRVTRPVALELGEAVWLGGHRGGLARCGHGRPTWISVTGPSPVRGALFLD